MELSRQYAKLCDVEDFADPELAAAIADIAPSQSADRPHRKGWELAMGALFLGDVGRLRAETEILDVGAGSEEIMYWLAARSRRVVAIDIYGRGRFAHGEAARSMLENPSAHAPYDYPRERLTVREMDARRLEFPDASFDAVVSFSSVEHFGRPADIARSAGEIGRVLRPGGHAFIVSELLLTTSPLTATPVQFAVRLATFGRLCAGATPRRRVVGEVFTVRTLQRDVIAPSGLQLMQPIDLTRSPASSATIQVLHRDGKITSTTGRPYPHVTVGTMGMTWTSLALPLVKPAA